MPVEDWHPRTTKISAADRVDAEQNERNAFLSVWKNVALRFSFFSRVFFVVFGMFFFCRTGFRERKKNDKIYVREKYFFNAENSL